MFSLGLNQRNGSFGTYRTYERNPKKFTLNIKRIPIICHYFEDENITKKVTRLMEIPLNEANGEM